MTSRDTSSRPAHHVEGGFRNNHGSFEPKGLAEVLRWRWNAQRAGLPPPPRTPIPSVQADLDFLHRNAAAGRAMQSAVTWIGHATVLAQLNGLSLLTDPIFSERASPLPFAGPRRHVPPGLAMHELPHIDVVLVSHNHYDHLDAASVDTLQRQPGGPPVFVVPLGLAAWLKARGVSHAIELDWWQSAPLRSPRGDADVTLVPAQHWSGRGLRDRMKTLWGGFAVLSDDCHLFYAGDTGYSRDFADMRRHFSPRQAEADGGGFDIALLPIGSYEPRWFMANQHVNVEEAVRIHHDLGAKRSLGVHWGTFELTDEPLDEPPRVLHEERRRRGLAEDRFFVVAVGETRVVPSRRVARAAQPLSAGGS